MRVKLPGRSLYNHQKLQSEDSPVKPSHMMGMSSKAKSCKVMSSCCDEFDVKPSPGFHLLPSPRPACLTKTNSNAISRPPRTVKPKMVMASSSKQTSFRNLFTSREERVVVPPPGLRAKSKQQPDPKSVASRQRRQKSVTPLPTRPKLVRIDEHPPTAAPRSLDFDIPSSHANLAPPSLRRSRSAPQTSQSIESLHRMQSSVRMKNSIRQLDMYLAGMSSSNHHSRADEVSIQEVPPAILTKPTKPLRNPYENMPNLSSSRHKAKPMKSSMSLSPVPVPRDNTSNGHNMYGMPPTAAPVALPPRHPKRSNSSSTEGSLKSISQAYKQIMVEFGDESSEATTGW